MVARDFVRHLKGAAAADVKIPLIREKAGENHKIRDDYSCY